MVFFSLRQAEWKKHMNSRAAVNKWMPVSEQVNQALCKQTQIRSLNKLVLS